jgi:RND family efflux transporter MFP subunit
VTARKKTPWPLAVAAAPGPALLLALGLSLSLTLALACGHDGASSGDAGSGGDGGAPGAATTTVPAGTPVQVARVQTAVMRDQVVAPGQTVALVEQKVRAPFDGTLTALDVVEGSRVTAGQRIGEIVARDSEAALEGAREMRHQAHTDAERAEAERALELARGNLVTAPLSTSVAGLVTLRSAATGDRVAADQELVTIAAADSLVFRADVPQSELGRIEPGQAATVELAGGGKALAARVHGPLAPEMKSDLTAPLRLDFTSPPALPVPGRFGTARITVAEHRGAPVVPLAAVLRDDVSGTSRVGTVGDGGKLHWVQVTTGIENGDRVEILSPPLAARTRVVVSGQVGLAEGTPLAIQANQP